MNSDVLRNQIKSSNMMKTNIYKERYQIRSIDWMTEDNIFIIVVKNKETGINKEYIYRFLPTWIRKWMFTDEDYYYKGNTKRLAIGIY